MVWLVHLARALPGADGASGVNDLLNASGLQAAFMTAFMTAFTTTFTTAFTAWGAPTTWLELIAFILALAMVGCNIREIHWGWPLAALSSLLYFALFWRSKLYGDAVLQIFFVLVAVWGWWQWLRGRPNDTHPITGPVLSHRPALLVRQLGRAHKAYAFALALALWPITGWFLKNFTDTDVPWWDAFPTATSIIGQFLLGRKFIETWPVWVVVNIASVGLFAYKGLWLTVLLYSLFVALSFLGWRVWQAQLRGATSGP